MKGTPRRPSALTDSTAVPALTYSYRWYIDGKYFHLIPLVSNPVTALVNFSLFYILKISGTRIVLCHQGHAHRWILGKPLTETILAPYQWPHKSRVFSRGNALCNNASPSLCRVIMHHVQERSTEATMWGPSIFNNKLFRFFLQL